MPAVRPEFENPPEVFYSATEAKRYTVNTRIRKIQREMTLRALELLNLPKVTTTSSLLELQPSSPARNASTEHTSREQMNRNREPVYASTNNIATNTAPVLSTCQCLLLDIGCGSGLSGEVLTEEGHAWIGVDVSSEMLAIAKEDELRYYNVTRELPLQDKQFTSNQNVFTVNSSGKIVDNCDGCVVPTRVDTSHVKWGLITSESSNEGDTDSNDECNEGKHNQNNKNGVDDSYSNADSNAASQCSTYMAEVLLNDVGQGLPFRPGTFDGCVSISALQWLCHSSRKGEVPQRRLMSLFQSLYNLLRRGAKAAMQFYPSHPAQIHMITTAAMKCGFSGGVVIDFPHSARAKKHYLVIQAGQVGGVGFVPPAPLTNEVFDDEDEDDNSSYDYYEEEEEEEEEEQYDADARNHHRRTNSDAEYANPFDRIQVGERGCNAQRKRPRAHSSHGAQHRHELRRRKDNRPVTGTREWVLMKKDERRRRGMKTTADSKYTMRRRKPRF